MSCNHQTTYIAKLIKKNQCAYCYHEDINQSGINLCLICYSSYCQQHMELHQYHNNFLNIQKKIKKQEQNTEQIVINDIQYEYDYKFLCTNCKQEFQDEQTLSTIQNQVSYNLQDQNKWQDEAVDCIHTQNYQIQGQIQNNLSKCNLCDLTQNLWLCLNCGLVSCGRRQYDGSGGNNHGIEHYEQSNHYLALKIGTISSNSTPSIFCYKCGDDVRIPNIKDILKNNFNIDPTNQLKSEMTTQELNLQMNIEQNNIKDNSKDEQNLIQISQTGFVGLKNLGNSCYVNSLIQSFLIIKNFQNQFEESTHFCKSPFSCLQCQLVKLYKWCCKNQNVIQIFDFMNIISNKKPQFNNRNQQDVFEYFLSVLEVFEEQNIQTDFLKCRNCQSVYIQYEINNFYSHNQNQIELQLHCQKCNGNQQFIRTQEVIYSGEYLFMVVNRTQFKDGNVIKIEDEFQNLESLQFIQNQKTQYTTEQIMIKKKEIQFDQSKINELVQMGFNINSVKRTLLRESDIENAINILCMNVEDEEYQKPLLDNEIYQENGSYEQLIQLGFDQELSLIASNYSQDIEKCILFIENLQKLKKNAQYQLVSSIVHYGKNITSGHYINFIKKDNQWYKFNDESIHKLNNPNVGKGYLFMYKIIQ